MHKVYPKRAVGSFFEEIPALFLVVVSIALLISSLFVTSARYNQQNTTTNFFQQGYTFMEEIRSYKNLTYQNEPGIFNVYAMGNLTRQNITYDLHPMFGYYINITDVSGYHVKYNHTVYSSPIPKNTLGLKYGIVTVSSTVDIWVSPTEIHLAKLTVTIWM